jgi:hypothetical protein
MLGRLVLLALAMTVESAWGSISIDATTSGNQATASTAVTTPTFSTAYGNELLLAFVASDYLSGTNTTATGVSGAGLTWVLVLRTNVQSGTAEIWRAFAPAPLSNVTVTAALSQSAVSSITVVSLAGVDTSGTNGSGAIGATAGANASSGAPTASLKTTRANSWVFGVGNDYDSATQRTLGTGQTLVSQYLPSVGDTYWVQRQTSPTPASGTTVTINDTAPTTDRYNLSICEVLPATSGTTTTWGISGTITPSSAGSGATVTLSGAASATTTADSSGNFSFTGLANGSYTVTPSRSGYAFTPASQSITVSGANQTGIAFTGVAVLTARRSSGRSISGTISPSSAGSGATVTLAGAASATTTADSSGNFSFTGLANGSYTVAPSRSGYTFTPAGRSVTLSGANQTGINFTGQAVTATWSISGTISPSTAGSGATVTLAGAASATTTADSSGNFSFTGLANGSYTVAPSRTGYTFTPASQAVTLNGANQTGIAFTGQAAAAAGTISIDTTVSGDQGTASTTVATPAFSTAYGKELLLAFISSDYLSGANTTVTGISGAGLTWELVLRTNVQLGTSEIWRAFAASTLSNVTVKATLSQSAVSSITVVSLAGVDTSGTNGSGAIGATAGTNAASGAPTASLVTTRANSWVFGVGNDYDNATARTPGTSQTIIHQYLPSIGDSYWVQRQTNSIAASGTRVTINDTAPATDRYNLSICEVLAATSAGTTTWSISGTITPTAAGSGATVTLSGTASAATTADSSGNFSFTGLTNGSYTVTPARSGYAFTPASVTATVTGANVTGLSFTGTASGSVVTPNVTVDGSSVSQTMDGMGTNINSWAWKNGELKPALDLLVDTNGANVFRVIHDRMSWATQSQIAGLHARDAATLAAVYETSDMQDLWNTIAYLNTKGVKGKQILLNFMGWTSTWMGGSGQYNVVSYINSSNNTDIATMVASLVYYGRVVKQLDFSLVSPFNESDWNGLEGPILSASQYGAIAGSIISELNLMGQTDVMLVGPDTASSPGAYIDVLQGLSAVYPRIAHFGFHSYSTGGVSADSHTGRTQWLDETSAWCSGCDNNAQVSDEWSFARDQSDYLLADLANGFTAILTWEGFDTFYYHHNSYSTWGQVGCTQGGSSCSTSDAAGTRVYALRKRGYTTAILNNGIRPGMAKIGVTKSLSFPILAFYNSTTGEISILGHNTGTSAATINGKLNSLPAVTGFLHYQTDSGSKNFARQTDVTVSGQTFTTSIPAGTFFLLRFQPGS